MIPRPRLRTATEIAERERLPYLRFRVTKRMHAEIAALALSRGQSKGQLVRLALRRYLDDPTR